MITPDQVFDLLALAQAFDSRTVGVTDAEAWTAVAMSQRWQAPLAKKVLIDYYSAGADKPRITPAHVTDGIRKARKDAMVSFEPPVCPAHVLDGGRYPEWLREQPDAHADRVLADWVRGAPMPVAVEDAPGRLALPSASPNRPMSDAERAARMEIARYLPSGSSASI